MKKNLIPHFNSILQYVSLDIRGEVKLIHLTQNLNFILQLKFKLQATTTTKITFDCILANLSLILIILFNKSNPTSKFHEKAVSHKHDLNHMN